MALQVLKDKKALVVGVANEHSIAYGCASAFRELNEAVARRLSGQKLYVDGGVSIMV